MSGWVVRVFKGVAPRLSPRLLQDNQAQIAANCKVWNGALTPLATDQQIMTVGAEVKTIYRFGVDHPSDSQYWFKWNKSVNVVKGPVAGDLQERTYFTGDGVPKVTDSSIATAGASYPAAAYDLAIYQPTSAPVVNLGGVANDGALLEERIYAYTLVTTWGEEGPPSPPSLPMEFYEGMTVEVAGLQTPSGGRVYAYKRIYRAVDGVWLFVKEIPVAQVSTPDDVVGTELGEVMPTIDYANPPDDLQGLCSMAGGIMAGFVGKDLFFCEPFKPYAWPNAYMMASDIEIVALASLDTSMIVLTKSFPYIVQGSHPSVMSMVKADIPQACVSARSVVVAAGGVIYASPDGLFFISSSGTRNLTEALFTNKEWSAFFKPESINAYLYDNRYYAFYDNGTTKGGFIFDMSSGDLTMLTTHATAGYYDPMRDALFLVVNGELVKFDKGSSNRTVIWRSKAFYSPKPINLGAGRVEAMSYPLTLRVYADGALRHTQTVTSPHGFRLPSGFMANVWEFEIESDKEVLSAGFAEAMSELKNG